MGKLKILIILSVLLGVSFAAGEINFRSDQPIDFYNDLYMQKKQVRNLSAPTVTGDAVNLGYTQTRYLKRDSSDSMNGTLDMLGHDIVNVNSLSNGTPNTLKIGSNGNIEIPNGDLEVSGLTDVGDAIVRGNLNMDNGQVTEVKAIRSGGTDLDLITSGSGDDAVTIYDENNSRYIAQFKEGGNIEIPNGNLNLSGNNIQLSGGYLSNDGENEGLSVDNVGNLDLKNGTLEIGYDHTMGEYEGLEITQVSSGNSEQVKIRSGTDSSAELTFQDISSSNWKWGFRVRGSTGDFYLDNHQDLQSRMLMEKEGPTKFIGRDFIVNNGSSNNLLTVNKNSGNVKIPNGGLDVSSPSNTDHTVDIGGGLGVEGNLDMGDNQLDNIGGLKDCGPGEAILGDGSCGSTGSEIQDVWVNESGDTMTGGLDMNGNPITSAGSVTVQNSFQLPVGTDAY